MVNVSELANSYVYLAVRPFCKPKNYCDVYFAIIEGTLQSLDSAGIEISYAHEVQINK